MINPSLAAYQNYASDCNLVLGLEQASEDELYEAMDWLVSKQEFIENELAKIHLTEGALVLYDVSSTYFEGTQCPSLSQVEQAFRSYKTVDLKVRPIYHRLEQRVKAHVFLCMLASGCRVAHEESFSPASPLSSFLSTLKASSVNLWSSCY